MLLEFDADQRLWQETVRDAVAKQCPPTLVRGVAEDGVDPTPLWKTYVDAGWTELTDPENAVELAIVLEELGRATDPTPFLATLTQFAPWPATGSTRSRSGTAVYGGVTAHRDADGWVLDGTAHHVLDGDRAEKLAVVTDGRGVRRRRASAVDRAQPGVRSGAAHRRGVVRRRARRRHRPRPRGHGAGPSRRAHRYGDHHGRRVPTHPRPGARTCEAAAAVRRGDRLLPGRPAQGRRHARRHRARPRAVLLRRADDRGRRSAPAAGGRDGQGGGGGVPGGGVPPWPAAVRRHGFHMGERPSVRAQARQSRRTAARRRSRASRGDRGGVRGSNAADFRFRRRGVPRRVRGVPRRAPAVGGRDPGAAAVGVAYAAVGARLAAAAVRQRLAAARATAGVRWPQRDRAAAVRAPRGTVPAPDLSQLQPAGREHHCGVADFVRLRRAETPLGGAGAQGRDDRVARDERAERRLRPGVAADPRGARRRSFRGQRPEGVDLRRPRRRLSC